MATQKEVKSRIASIKNINKITRAMEMVAAARLRRSEQRIADLRPYSEGMRKLTRIASAHAGGLPRVPVLAEALPCIGHVAIRNRGTVGGSLAHADASAELPAVAVATGATMVLRPSSSERTARSSARTCAGKPSVKPWAMPWQRNKFSFNKQFPSAFSGGNFYLRQELALV